MTYDSSSKPSLWRRILKKPKPAKARDSLKAEDSFDPTKTITGYDVGAPVPAAPVLPAPAPVVKPVRKDTPVPAVSKPVSGGTPTRNTTYSSRGTTSSGGGTGLSTSTPVFTDSGSYGGGHGGGHCSSSGGGGWSGGDSGGCSSSSSGGGGGDSGGGSSSC